MRKYFVRIEHHGRVEYLLIPGQTLAVRIARVYANRDQHVTVLDATGRVVWRPVDCPTL